MPFSVILSIYYKESPLFLRESLDSLFSQTVCPDEVILVKDGPIGDELDNVIDLSPMGCRTGFYLVMWGDVDAKTIKEGLERALEKVLKADKMIAATSVECGNYRDLSLFGAKEYAKYVLEQGFSLNIYGE